MTLEPERERPVAWGVFRNYLQQRCKPEEFEFIEKIAEEAYSYGAHISCRETMINIELKRLRKSLSKIEKSISEFLEWEINKDDG